MRYFATVFAIVFVSFVYGRQIVPVTTVSPGYPSCIASAPDAVYILYKLNGGSSLDTMRYAVYKFDGTTSTKVLTIACEPGKEIYCLTYWNNKICLGGKFQDLFGIPGADGVIAWSNGVYEALGTGISTNPLSVIRCMNVFENKLLAGGQLMMTTGSSFHPLAVFDGTGWSNLGAAFLNPICMTATMITDLTVAGSRLYLKGEFEYIDNVPVNNIAYFENGSYHALGNGLPSIIAGNETGIGVSGNNVFVEVVEDALPYLNRVKRWDGTAWSTVFTDDGTQSPINKIAHCNGVTVLAGGSTTAGPFDALYAFENNTLQPFTGIQNYAYIYTMFAFNNNIYCIGTFKVTGDNTTYNFGKTTTSAIPTGIQAMTDADMQVYPNPFADNITISSNEPIEQVQLADLGGRKVMDISNAEKSLSVNTAQLPAGVYIIDIKTAAAVTQRKLVKAN